MYGLWEKGVHLAIIILCTTSIPLRAWLGDLGYCTALSFSLGCGGTLLFFVPFLFTNASSVGAHVAGFE